MTNEPREAASTAVRARPARRIATAFVLVVALAGCGAAEPTSSTAPPLEPGRSASSSPPPPGQGPIADPGSSMTPRPGGSPVPQPAPSFNPLPVDPSGSILGPPGSIVSVDWTAGTINVVSSSPTGRTLGAIAVPAGALSRWLLDDPPGIIAANGWLLLSVCKRGVVLCEFAMVDLRHPDAPPGFVTRPMGFAFLSTGTLVGLNAQGTEILRDRAPYGGDLLRTRIPPGVVIPDTYGPSPLSIAADGSGVYGIRSARAANGDPLQWGTEVLVTWDGAAHPADPRDDPMQFFGTQRTVGSDGQSVFRSKKGPNAAGASAFSVQGPATPRFDSSIGNVQDVQWMPGGEALVFVADNRVWTLRGRREQVLVKLPTLEDGDSYGSIEGLSKDVVLFYDEGFETTHILSIAAGTFVETPGYVVGIVPSASR